VSPLLYAHRGAAAEEPENTLPSFRRALEVGANALETDLHMTSDGHVVLSHDPLGERMAGVRAEIRARSLAAVQRWDAGWGFVKNGERPFAGKGYRVPTLAELLEEIKDVPINVDIKQKKPDMVDAVLKVIRDQRAEERVTIASFDVFTLRRVRARGYRGPTGLAREEVLLLLTPLTRFFPPAGRAAQLPDRLGTRGVIQKCHQLGLVAHFWTINDPARARALLAMGADGIMTDDPRAVAPVFYERSASAW
jgi:glycerophosphoryl diester phosphodiesterase